MSTATVYELNRLSKLLTSRSLKKLDAANAAALQDRAQATQPPRPGASGSNDPANWRLAHAEANNKNPTQPSPYPGAFGTTEESIRAIYSEDPALAERIVDTLAAAEQEVKAGDPDKQDMLRALIALYSEMAAYVEAHKQPATVDRSARAHDLFKSARPVDGGALLFNLGR